MGVTRAELKGRAKEALKGKWGMMAVVTILVMAISTAVGLIPVLGSIASIFLAPALQAGLVIISLRVARHQEVGIGNLFDGFQFVLKATGLTLVIGIFTFLWSLLLIIPGIVATIRYSMAVYILVENPNKGIMQCINESKELTQGYKMDLFILQLSFIGWALLIPFTLGIGYLFLVPYMQITMVYAYLQLAYATRTRGYSPEL